MKEEWGKEWEYLSITGDRHGIEERKAWDRHPPT